MMQIPTDFTKMLGLRYPIIGAPMFLVSNIEMVAAISEAGGIGTFPSLNYRPSQQFGEMLKQLKTMTKKPIGVNIIVNKTNLRQEEDFRLSLEHGVELFITSLGNPKQIILDAHKNGAKVFCDVTSLEHALKVQDLGADGVIAVASGAGGHAGHISPLVLIPWLKRKLSIPIVAAGGIADGATFAAALALGASAVSVGTRFIASHEAKVNAAYKEAILKSSPEDIMMTKRLSGTPAAVIRTPYVEKMGSELPWLVEMLKNNKFTKKLIMPLIHLSGMKDLEQAITGPTWKTVWSAGQSVGLVDEIKTCREIMADLVNGYQKTIENLPKAL